MNVQKLSDQALLDSYMQGNRSAISTLIEKYNQRVRDYIRMMVKDAELADDLLQEVLIKAVRVIDEGRYTDNGKFLSWLMRIAHNQVIDHFRAKSNVQHVSESSSGYNILGTMAYSSGNIEDEMVVEQTHAQLRKLVELLPDEQREVVMLRYYSELSFKEIAEQTGVSINTALGRMRYALLNLRKMMAEKNIALC